jgi:hypothetical protein
VRLDWNDIRAKAAVFSQEWSEAFYEKGDTQTFYNEFFEVFGVPRKRVASFEQAVKLNAKDSGFIDLFWPGKLLVEQKSAGRDLIRAKKQAFKYFPGLSDHELPRYVLLSDFQNFELLDLEAAPNDPIRFKLSELPDRVQDFGFIVGQEKRVFKDQDPVNIRASEIMGALHDSLEASGYTGHALERFLVRLLFCLFADDTGIFQPLGLFQDFVAERTREDGSDLGPLLMQVFQVLDTPEAHRHSTLDADLTKLPHINGDLFAETLPLPSFNREMRDKLLFACGFNWEKVSPAIFGSLFQSVMNKAERRKKGAHYTSEKNILKVIEPLFMDDLRAEFAGLKARRDTGRQKALEAFHAKLGQLKFFDPACGCGNFLVIAYRELRTLELEVMQALFPKDQLVTDIGLYTQVNVDQFYGIEIGEFPARIAEVAMWMMDHIMNARLSAEFGQSYLRIPLKASPNIRNADALEIGWEEVLAPDDCDFVFGNPPFIGAKNQSPAQRVQIIRIADLGKNGGTLDYVAAWFLKAGAYLAAADLRAPRIGFVATNSITQGEQVAQLWPTLFARYGLEIAFAHQTFQWMSDARGMAHVHCVIIGLTRREAQPKEKRLFSYETVTSDPVETRHSALMAYLIDADGFPNRHMCIREEAKPINLAPTLITGTQPLENGNLTFNAEQMDHFIKSEPQSAKYFRLFPGAKEYIQGQKRWILHCADISPKELRTMTKTIDRLNLIKKFRQTSKRKTTFSLSEYPTRYGVNVIPSNPFLIIPQTSSENRDYVPMGWLEPPTIPSEKLRILNDATVYDFAILTSRMHMAWMRTVTGRMKSDYMYSVGVVYNTFPWPQADEAQQHKVSALAQDVLDARAAHPDATLADLYDPDAMPPNLRKAHTALDQAVDRLYRKDPFPADRDRVEHLFTLYERLTADLFTPVKTPKRARNAKAGTQNLAHR